MMNQKKYLSLTALIMLVFISCAVRTEQGAYEFIESYGAHDPSPSHFSVCYAHGCNRSADVQLSREEWNSVRQAFDLGPSDAAQERQGIAKAIGILETIVGKLTGTEADLGGSLPGTFKLYQMDCVDETFNTTTYLAMMKNDGLLRFHDLMEPAYRWAHVSAVIIEKLSGEEYAVDSWFLDNGQPPFIIPLKQWKNGWKP
jgi:hypothetical protein